jgi:hypothetical protein
MAAKAQPVLEPRQLNEADREILDELHEGRASPSYLSEQTGVEQTYINQRLRRLDEHAHVENLARGLWELVDDPRDDAGEDNVEELKRHVRAAGEAIEEQDVDALRRHVRAACEVLDDD